MTSRTVYRSIGFACIMPWVLAFCIILTGCQTVPDSAQNIDFNRVFKLSEVDVIPKRIHIAQPVYPFELRRAGISGSAKVAFVVDKDGKVIDLHIVEATQPGFGEASVKCVKKWTFSPGLKQGRPVAVSMYQVLTFEVEGPLH